MELVLLMVRAEPAQPPKSAVELCPPLRVIRTNHVGHAQWPWPKFEGAINGRQARRFHAQTNKLECLRNRMGIWKESILHGLAFITSVPNRVCLPGNVWRRGVLQKIFEPMKTFLAIFGSVIFGLSVGFAQPEVKQPARSFPGPPGVKGAFIKRSRTQVRMPRLCP